MEINIILLTYLTLAVLGQVVPSARPIEPARRPTSDFRLLSDLEGIVDFDPAIADGRLALGVSK